MSTAEQANENAKENTTQQPDTTAAQTNQCQYRYVKGARKGEKCQNSTQKKYCSDCVSKKNIQPKSDVAEKVFKINNDVENVLENLTYQSLIDNKSVGLENSPHIPENKLREELRLALTERLLGKTIRDFGEAKYRQAGSVIEQTSRQLGYNMDVHPGKTVTHDNEGIFFSKRVGPHSQSLNTKKLFKELERLGVSKSLINEAKRNATEQKPAITYLAVGYN